MEEQTNRVTDRFTFSSQGTLFEIDGKQVPFDEYVKLVNQNEEITTDEKFSIGDQVVLKEGEIVKIAIVNFEIDGKKVSDYAGPLIEHSDGNYLMFNQDEILERYHSKGKNK